MVGCEDICLRKCSEKEGATIFSFCFVLFICLFVFVTFSLSTCGHGNTQASKLSLGGGLYVCLLLLVYVANTSAFECGNLWLRKCSGSASVVDCLFVCFFVCCFVYCFQFMLQVQLLLSVETFGCGNALAGKQAGSVVGCLFVYLFVTFSLCCKYV